MKYPQLSTIVSYKCNDYEVVAIEYDKVENTCKYHLRNEEGKIIVDVEDLSCNYKYRNIEKKK